ncbi:hypothetical protein BDV24DRAFT_130884 [Aspergillus arachidicola]|nr:hypothetical protein BDV24DRAFT_130884 [Aspergillus arachidicola]
MPSLCENYFCKDMTDATASDFISLCGKIKTLAPDRKKHSTLGKKNIKASTQTSWLNLEKPNDKLSEKHVAKRNEPPQTVSVEEWVKDWVASPSQKTESGKCAFCKFPGHGAADCYYLNISNRPNGWKPRRALWCYQP